jgi:hypothetical protein
VFIQELIVSLLHTLGSEQWLTRPEQHCQGSRWLLCVHWCGRAYP